MEPARLPRSWDQSNFDASYGLRKSNPDPFHSEPPLPARNLLAASSTTAGSSRENPRLGNDNPLGIVKLFHSDEVPVLDLGICEFAGFDGLSNRTT